MFAGLVVLVVCVVDINVLLCGTMHDASEYIEMVNVLF